MGKKNTTVEIANTVLRSSLGKNENKKNVFIRRIDVHILDVKMYSDGTKPKRGNGKKTKNKKFDCLGPSR